MKRILTIVVIVVVILALVGWRIVTKTEASSKLDKQSQAARTAPTVVQLATAGPQKIQSAVNAVGTIESPFQVKLSPNIAGRIDFLQAREGDKVHVGQVLARIDPQFVEAQILQAQGNLAQAQQNLTKERITEDANTVTINSTIAQTKAAVASAQADYNEAVTTADQTIGAAHEATVDAEAKVASARSAVLSAEANVALAKANLDDASAKYKREDSLYKQGFVAAQDLDDAMAAQKVDVATVTYNEKNLDAAKSSLNSFQAEYRAAADQEQVIRKQQASAIADAKSKYVQAEKTLDTAVANRTQIPAYAESIKALQSAVDAASAALKQAVAQRAYLTVTSSIDGTVTQRLFDPGAEATPGSPLLIVQADKQLFVTTAMPVEDSGLVRLGMNLELRIDALPGQKFNSKVDYINKVADPTSRQFMVRTTLDNPKGIFRPGMYCRVRIVTNYVSAPVAVPHEAVTTDTSNNSTVIVVDSNMVAHVTPVTLGVSDPNNTQILSGVKAGDKVVQMSYRKVQDGKKVAEGTWKVGGKEPPKSTNGIPPGPDENGNVAAGGANGPSGYSGVPNNNANTGSTAGGGGGGGGGAAPATTGSGASATGSEAAPVGTTGTAQSAPVSAPSASSASSAASGAHAGTTGTSSAAPTAPAGQSGTPGTTVTTGPGTVGGTTGTTGSVGSSTGTTGTTGASGHGGGGH